MRVTIVGAGLMGAQIGCEYACGGHDVVLYARNIEAARARVMAGFELLEAHGLRSPVEVRNAAARITATTSATEAADGAALLVESLPEDIGLKADVLGGLLAAADEPTVATNTSSIEIGAIGDAIGAPERTIGTHYLNPPLLMPTVEVIPGGRTSQAALALVRDTLVALGKLPILVRRDVPGFIWNRLQFALVRECAWLVEQGVAAPEDVDRVVSEGLARRWRQVGPLRSIALGGVDTWNRSGHNIVPELSAATELPDLRTLALTDGDVERDIAKRDAALARELVDDRRAIE